MEEEEVKLPMRAIIAVNSKATRHKVSTKEQAVLAPVLSKKKQKMTRRNS